MGSSALTLNLARRLAKLEETIAPQRNNRLVLRFEGPGSEKFPQPTQQEIDAGIEILTIHIVEAKDGRPAERDLLRLVVAGAS